MLAVLDTRHALSGPWHHIRELREKHVEVVSDRAKLIKAVETMEDEKKIDLQLALDNLREELDNKRVDECERVKLESE